MFRITSYNVCYTKLLRYASEWSKESVVTMLHGASIVEAKTRKGSQAGCWLSQPHDGAVQPMVTPEHGKEQQVEKMRFTQLLNRIDDCGKAEQLNQLILEVTREYGYQYYQFCLLIPMGLLQCQIYLLSHSPDGWVKIV